MRNYLGSHIQYECCPQFDAFTRNSPHRRIIFRGLWKKLDASA